MLQNTTYKTFASLLTGIGSAKVDVPISAAQVQEALEHYRLLVRDAHLRHDPQA